MAEKTCFVIIGYGIKTDYSTGREMNLDKTYSNIIEPVFKDLGFLCFRASDIQHSGVIDLPMYEQILKADFVLADLTTLNANVLYELGIRHAVRRNTTIVISEKELNYPFDLSHIIIDKYEHLGRAIDFDEVVRFKEVLKGKVLSLLQNPQVDSPMYTFFPTLKAPSFTEDEIKEIKENKEAENSLSDILIEAESAKENSDFVTAIALLEKAAKITSANEFILQRLALATYKSKLPTALEALQKANSILEILNPENTTDIETLGLSGAINKRIYEELNEESYLEKALWFYKKGFYIGNDYYTGINAAYLLTIKSNLNVDKFEAYANYGEANIIRKKVIEIGVKLMGGKIWEERDDQKWILLSIAEAYFGLGDLVETENYVSKAMAYIKGNFSMTTFIEQQAKLAKSIELFKNRYLEND